MSSEPFFYFDSASIDKIGVDRNRGRNSVVMRMGVAGDGKNQFQKVGGVVRTENGMNLA